MDSQRIRRFKLGGFKGSRDLDSAHLSVSRRFREFNPSGFKGLRRVRRGIQGIHWIQTRRAHLIKGGLGA